MLSDTLKRLGAALADRYRIERELGRGGMATVYLAHDVKHDRQVALKVLDPELGAVLGAERFLAEIRVTAKLQHPNLLPLFDSGEANGLLFYVMPFVEGESLRARLDREKQLPIDQAIHFASAVANALDYAHGHGVIHRDLKPENILLQAGEPVVADFGIALAVSNAGGARITQTGLSLGTPQYMSPEQAAGDRTVDGRTDIYSLGAVTYEMLTGEAPHTGSTAQAIIAKLMTEEVHPLTVLRRNVPPHVEAAVLRALEKLPADRFATAHEFSNALQGHDSVINVTGRRSAAATSAKRTRWHYASWAAAAVFGVAALWSVRRGDRGAPDVVVSSLLPPADLDFSEQGSFGALSPDGRQFAFVTLGLRGETSLWVRRLDTLSARPLPGTAGARAPFWAPDGKRLAYVAGNVLYTVDVSGSVPRRVCDAPNASSGSWGTGDVMVIATPKGLLKASPSDPICPVAIAAEAGLPIDPRHPTLLPDGYHVLYSRYGERRDEIAVGDLRTGTSRTLLEQARDPTFVAPDILLFGEIASEGLSRLRAQRFDANQLRLTGPRILLSEDVRAAGGYFAYAAAGKALIYQPGLGDRGEIRTDRTGRVLDTIASGETWMHAWARDHSWIAHSSDSELRLFDVSRRVEVKLVRAHSFGGFSPAWAPHDSLLAYSSCDTLRCRLMVRNLATDRDTMLRSSPNSAGIHWPTSWSADGRFLVSSRLVAQYTAQSSQIWVYDMRSGTHSALVTQPGTLEGAISPDGRWLAYRSDESGAAEIMVRPFMRDGTPQRVSTAGGRLPQWRADGRELVFQAPDGHVMSADVMPGATFAFKPPRSLFAAPAWTRHVFFDIGTSFGMRPDAQQFTFRMTATGSTAVLVQNWTSLLK